MNCLKCASAALRTLKTIQDGAVTKRIKQCKECDFIFSTLEKPYFDNCATEEEVKYYEEYIAQNDYKSKK